MSKSFKKASPIKLRSVLATAEKIIVAANQDEKNEVLNDLYRVIHPFVGSCNNPHYDWREFQETINKELTPI